MHKKLVIPIEGTILVYVHISLLLLLLLKHERIISNDHIYFIPADIYMDNLTGIIFIKIHRRKSFIISVVKQLYSLAHE